MTDQGRVLSKYIRKIQAGRIGILTFSATGGSGDISTALTTALTTAGHGSTEVPLQVSSGINVEGVVASGSLNRVPIRVGNAIVDDGTGLEVYGRITESTGVYTLTYYVNDGGVETNHSFASPTNIDVYVPYRFTFGSYPGDSLISTPSIDTVADPAAIVVPTPISEELTVSGIDTLSALTQTPFAGTQVTLHCMGVTFNSAETPAPFTVAGTAITWSATNAEVTLDPAEDTTVIASYYY